MKKVLMAFAVLAFIGMVKAYASTAPMQVISSTYTVSGGSVCVLGTQGVGLAGVIVPDVAGALNMTQVVFEQEGAVAQTVTLYTLGASSKTITAVGSFYIPGTAGLYYPYSANAIPSDSAINFTDFCMRTTTTTNPVKANILKRQ